MVLNCRFTGGGYKNYRIAVLITCSEDSPGTIVRVAFKYGCFLVDCCSLV